MKVARWLNVVSRLWNQFQETRKISRREVTEHARAIANQEGLTARCDRGWQLLNSQMSSPLLLKPQFWGILCTEGLMRPLWPMVCIPLDLVQATSTLETGAVNLCALHWWVEIQYTDSPHVHIWRKSGIQYYSSNIMEVDYSGGGNIKVRAGMMLNGHRELHVHSGRHLDCSEV